MKSYLYKKPLENYCDRCGNPSRYGYVLSGNGDETPICQKCASHMKFSKKRRNSPNSVKSTNEAKQMNLEAFSCVNFSKKSIVAEESR